MAKLQPGRLHWTIVTVAIAALLLQVLLGLGAMNLENTDPGNQHVFYGVVISFTLAFAYIYRAQFRKRPASLLRGAVALSHGSGDQGNLDVRRELLNRA